MEAEAAVSFTSSRIEVVGGRPVAIAAVRTQPNPQQPTRLSRFRLFAVLGTWMEADIVKATVANARTQGCERVYLIDNGSSDDTVEAARSAGAMLAHSYATDHYDETLRLRHMNDVVASVSAAEREDHIWWLFLDADEFPHGPNGLTIREYLQTLDERFRIVGTRFFDHYPSQPPYYVSGRHPLDFQPLCQELSLPMCGAGHRKHPLQRYDRNGVPIECLTGFHNVSCAEPLYEPSEAAFVHHFPFREEGLTRRRLDLLWAAKGEIGPRALDEIRDGHMLARFRSLDAVYSQRWPEVVNFLALDPIAEALVPRPDPVGVDLDPWEALVAPAHHRVLRWYEKE